MRDFYFHPNNGGPIWENWALVALISGALYFYMSGTTTSTEITYNDFINQYLSKN